MSTYNYETDNVHAEDCDCSDCHFTWHNPVSDWAICNACKRQQLLEALLDQASKGGI